MHNKYPRPTATANQKQWDQIIFEMRPARYTPDQWYEQLTQGPVHVAPIHWAEILSEGQVLARDEMLAEKEISDRARDIIDREILALRARFETIKTEIAEWRDDLEEDIAETIAKHVIERTVELSDRVDLVVGQARATLAEMKAIVTNGSDMGAVLKRLDELDKIVTDLGRRALKDAGIWAPKAYAPGEAVTHDGSIFVAQRAVTRMKSRLRAPAGGWP
jgi:hypothetical protein